jgi:hypothetical protein
MSGERYRLTWASSYLKELQAFSNTRGYKIVPLPVSGSLQFSNNISPVMVEVQSCTPIMWMSIIHVKNGSLMTEV